MNIGFFYVPYYPLTMGRSVHGFNLVRGLKKRGHQILSCLGDGNPECINYDRTKWGALKVAQASDVLYIRIAGRPVHSYLEKSTLLKLLRPFSLPVVWEVNAPVEELQGTYPPGPERDFLIQRENRKRKILARLVDAGIGVSDVLKEYITTALGIKNAYAIPMPRIPSSLTPVSQSKRCSTVCRTALRYSGWEMPVPPGRASNYCLTLPGGCSSPIPMLFSYWLRETAWYPFPCSIISLC